MSIISLTEALAFLDIGTGYFEITAENDVLSMTSDQGGAVDIDIPDLTYEGDDLATALQTAMNANTTLTGGTITFAVSYSSSTYLFTINSGAGHTITIDVSASDAALEFGFTVDPTAAQSIVSDQAATEDPTAPVQVILDGVDSFVKGTHCDRDFEETSYKEYQNGKDRQRLYLKQYPIISVSRLSIGRDNSIKVNNTGTATYATVSVTSTGVVLNKDGTDSTNSPLLFSANATLTDMVTAINAETGWQSEVMNTSYASYTSTELIEMMGLQCLDATWAYLEIPNEPEDDFEVYAEEGYIYKAGGFPRGHRNIRTDYTAGYSSGDMPDRLKMACLILVKFIYQKRSEEIFGRKQYSLGAVRAIILEEGMPSEVRLILDKFARKDV